MPQIPLSLTPPRRRRFENFVAGPNRAVVSSLRHGLAESGWIHLCAGDGSGKSHLAMAALAEWGEAGRTTLYVPARERGAGRMLTGAEPALAVVDDVESLAGDPDSERALFNALNRWRAARAAVLLTGTGAAPFALPDLVSRIGQAARLTLRPLDDAAVEALIDRLIVDHGLVAGRGAVAYLCRHGPRAGGDLAALFERIGLRAQAERRTVSVPLVREELDAIRGGTRG